MRFFLKVKRGWLLVILLGTLIGSPFLGALVAEVAGQHLAFLVTAFGISAFMVLYFGWVWAIAEGANTRLDSQFKKSPLWLRLALAVMAVIYSINTLRSAWSVMGNGADPGGMSALDLLSMLATLYVAVFAARQLVVLERNQQVKSFEYVWSALLIWFFPIGIWFIQPRVNRLLGANDV